MTTQQLDLNFPQYARALASVVGNAPSDRSFVVGITGPWGGGKTTLMGAVAEELKDRCAIVSFNAWAHSRQEVVWRGLFVDMIDAMRAELTAAGDRIDPAKTAAAKQLIDDAEKALYSSFTKEIPGEMHLDAGQLAKSGARLAMRFVPWGDVGSSLLKWAFDRADDSKTAHKPSKGMSDKDAEAVLGIFRREIARVEVAQIRSLEQFQRNMQRVLDSVLTDKRRLLVLIDDVDRCLPEQCLEILEATKLYLNLPSCVFVIAIDQDVLQHALDLRYKQSAGSLGRINADTYAEKMVDLTFAIPPFDYGSFNGFVNGLVGSGALIRNQGMIERALPRTPRTWQRLSSRIELQKALLSQMGDKAAGQPFHVDLDWESAFIKLQTIAFRWPGFLRASGGLAGLIAVEAVVREASVHSTAFQELLLKKEMSDAIKQGSVKWRSVPSNLWQHLGDASLVYFLAQEPYFDGDKVTTDKLARVLSLELPRSSPA